jgi:hypothetical protein
VSASCAGYLVVVSPFHCLRARRVASPWPRLCRGGDFGPGALSENVS